MSRYVEVENGDEKLSVRYEPNSLMAAPLLAAKKAIEQEELLWLLGHKKHEVKQQLAIGNAAVCRQLGDELAAWFPGHADYLDSALAHWMCKRTLGAKPVILRRNIKSAEFSFDSF